MQAQPLRIVSLLPSATEMLCAMGGAGLLVGRSHECDFPAGIEGLPVLTSQAIRATEPAEIDRDVSRAQAAGESLYGLDAERLKSLEPDVILTQDLCAVCSIDLASVRRVAESLKKPARVVSLNAESVEGVLDDVMRVGAAAGLEREAMGLVANLRERLFGAQDHVNPFDDGPSACLLEWTDPLFCAGHWSVQLIERAGARCPLNPTKPKVGAGAAAGPLQSERTAGKSRRVSVEELVASRPEWLVIAPCGLDLEKTRACAEALKREPWWKELPAVRRGGVALVDGNQMFNRPGPRLVDAYEWLVGWMHGLPGLIPKGFPWEPLRG